MLGASMPNILLILLRILAGVVVALLLYVAFFLYEDEEARIQNRLEQIWQKINALQGAAMSKEVAFLQGATRTTSTILDRLLGHRLLSLQSVAVSMAFSLASLCLWLSVEERAYTHPLFFSVVLFIVLVLFALGSIPAFAASGRLPRRNLRFIPTTKPYLVSLIVLVISAAFWGAREVGFAAGLLGTDFIVILGVLLDVFFIAFFRWVLGTICRVSSLWAVALLLALTTTVTVLLIGPAVDQVLHLGLYEYQERVAPVGWIKHGGPLYVSSVSGTNLVDAACLLLLLVVMLILLAHRLLWPLIKRPIYAANRKQLIKNTKLLGAFGTMLLLYAFPNNPIVKWITHFLPNLKGG